MAAAAIHRILRHVALWHGITWTSVSHSLRVGGLIGEGLKISVFFVDISSTSRHCRDVASRIATLAVHRGAHDMTVPTCGVLKRTGLAMAQPLSPIPPPAIRGSIELYCCTR